MTRQNMIEAFIRGWEFAKSRPENDMPLSVAIAEYRKELAKIKRPRRWFRKPAAPE